MNAFCGPDLSHRTYSSSSSSSSSFIFEVFGDSDEGKGVGLFGLYDLSLQRGAAEFS